MFNTKKDYVKLVWFLVLYNLHKDLKLYSCEIIAMSLVMTDTKINI